MKIFQEGIALESNYYLFLYISIEGTIMISSEKSYNEKKPKRVCPKCKSENVIPIVYGLFVEPLPYEVIYGGCAVTNNSP